MSYQAIVEAYRPRAEVENQIKEFKPRSEIRNFPKNHVSRAA
jgi:hypothetical protein